MACCGLMSVLQRNKYLLYAGGVITQIYRLALLWLVLVLLRKMILVGLNSEDVLDEVSSFWRGFFLDTLSFETIIILLVSVTAAGCGFHVLWKYAIKKRAANLSKNLHHRLQEQFSKPFIPEEQSNQEEVMSKLLADLQKVEEFEDNVRFYLFSERLFIVIAVIFLFIVSWELALISTGLVAFVWVVESIFSRLFLRKLILDNEQKKQELSNDRMNLFQLRGVSIISQTQEKEKERLNEKLEAVDRFVSSYLFRQTPLQFFKFYFLSIVGSILVIFTYYNDPDVESVFATEVAIAVLWELRSSLIAVEYMRPMEIDAWGSVVKCEAILEEYERDNTTEEGGCCCLGGKTEGEVMVEMAVMDDDSVEEEGNMNSPIRFEKSFGLRDAELSYATPQGDVHIIQAGFNIEIQKGEIVGLVGERGSGKSTILKHLMGLMAPAKGSFVVDGKEMTQKNIGGYLSNVTATFQSSELFSRTISENVAYGMEVEGDVVEKSLEKAKMLETVTGLEDGTQHIFDKNENIFSGGQKQRIQLARMFAQGEGKEIVFIDEPTSHLDHKMVESLLPELKEFLEGRTCVIISQDLSLLNNLCTRIIEIAPHDGPPAPFQYTAPAPLPPLSNIFSVLSSNDRSARNDTTYFF